MVKVISFSLWGNIKTYNIGCIKNVIIAKHLFPDWEVWVYYNTQTTPGCVIEWLRQQSNTRLYPINDGNVANTFKTNGQQGSIWRLYPLDKTLHPNVEVVISRDTDSRLSYYEFIEIEEWLKDKSENDVGILSMIDGYERTKGKIVRAGTCGFKLNKETTINIAQLLKSVFHDKSKLDFYCDETLLQHIITKHDLLKTVKFIPRGVKDKIGNPKTCELFTDYVGEVLDENNNKVDKNRNRVWQNRRLTDNDKIEQYIVNDEKIIKSFITRNVTK